MASIAVIKGLKTFLSDTYILYIKTQNFHWNVEGPNFGPLHQLFEDQYIDLRDAADLVAERIRALGSYSPGSCKEFGAEAGVREALGNGAKSPEAMLQELARDNRMMANNGRDFARELQKLDEATAHIILDRVVVHEKAAWMLESSLT